MLLIIIEFITDFWNLSDSGDILFIENWILIYKKFHKCSRATQNQSLLFLYISVWKSSFNWKNLIVHITWFTCYIQSKFTCWAVIDAIFIWRCYKNNRHVFLYTEVKWKEPSLNVLYINLCIKMFQG
jgi:hypothetical protein